MKLKRVLGKARGWMGGRLHTGLSLVLALAAFLALAILRPDLMLKGMDWNLNLIKWSGEAFGAAFSRYWADLAMVAVRNINFERILLYAEIAALVELCLLALGHGFRGCKALWRKATAPTTELRAENPPAEPRQDASTTEHEGVKIMSRTSRAIGHVFADIADLLWIVSIVLLAYLLIPQIHDQTMDVTNIVVPVNGGTTIEKLLLVGMPWALAAVVGFNLLAGRWAPPDHIRRGVWMSRVAVVAFAAIIFIVFGVNKGVTGLSQDLELSAASGAVALFVFAIIDLMYSKGDQFRASSLNNTAVLELQQENAALRARLAGTTARMAAPANVADVGIEHSASLSNLFQQLRLLGQVKIGPFNNVYIEMVPGVGPVVDIPELDVLRLTPTLRSVATGTGPAGEAARPAGEAAASA